MASPARNFFIFMQFSGKIGQNNRLALLPPLGLAPPPREILDPGGGHNYPVFIQRHLSCPAGGSTIPVKNLLEEQAPNT